VNSLQVYMVLHTYNVVQTDQSDSFSQAAGEFQVTVYYDVV